jgi:hypothetical protein
MNVKSYFKTLNLLFYALLAGQLSFAFIVLILTFSGSWHSTIDTNNIYYFVVLMVVAGVYYGGNFLYKSMMQKIKTKESLINKFDQMRIAFILKFTLLETASFISIVFYLLTMDYMFLIVALLVIFLFFISRLNKEQIITDMNLSDDEKLIIQDTNTIISSKM